MEKRVFVIMPFVKANERDQQDLDHFFEYNLKKRIEEEKSLQHTYIVTRSGASFDIPTQITRDLYSSDIVLCDLSGSETPNPNVMFELGIRFSISTKPVVLFREESSQNERVFDIGWLHTFTYKTTQLSKLEDYIIDRLKTYEINPNDYRSPVHNALGSEFSLKKEMEKNQVRALIDSAAAALLAMRLEFATQILKHLESINYSFPKEIKDTDQLDDYWSENRDELRKQDWDDFKFKSRPPSALEAILTTLPFNQYLPDSIRSEINSKLMEFYVESFLCPTASDGNFSTINNNYIRFVNIPSILGAIAMYIETDDSSKKLSIYDQLVSSLR